jgi:hypothetical protein
VLACGLTVLATKDDQASPTTEHEIAHDSAPIAVTINEARRLIAALILGVRHVGQALIDHLLNWSNWRRQHQVTARAAHYQRRLAIQTC